MAADPWAAAVVDALAQPTPGTIKFTINNGGIEMDDNTEAMHMEDVRPMPGTSLEQDVEKRRAEREDMLQRQADRHEQESELYDRLADN